MYIRFSISTPATKNWPFKLHMIKGLQCHSNQLLQLLDLEEKKAKKKKKKKKKIQTHKTKTSILYNWSLTLS